MDIYTPSVVVIHTTSSCEANVNEYSQLNFEWVNDRDHRILRLLGPPLSRDDVPTRRTQSVSIFTSKLEMIHRCSKRKKSVLCPYKGSVLENLCCISFYDLQSSIYGFVWRALRSVFHFITWYKAYLAGAIHK